MTVKWQTILQSRSAGGPATVFYVDRLHEALLLRSYFLRRYKCMNSGHVICDMDSFIATYVLSHCQYVVVNGPRAGFEPTVIWQPPPDQPVFFRDRRQHLHT